MGKQLGFYINSSICTECKACQIACQDKNDLPATLIWRRVFEYEGGNWVPDGKVMRPNNVFAYSLSVACMHCANPLCAEVCPTQAMHKTDNGLVQINADACIGCRYCEWACPYGAPRFDETKGVMTKCTGCEDLVAQGQNPACVDACVMRAIEFGELDALRAKYGNAAAIEPLPDPSLTSPSLVITPHKNAEASGKGTGRIQNLPEELV